MGETLVVSEWNRDTEMLSDSDDRGTLMMSGDPPDGGLTEVKSVLGKYSFGLWEDTLG